jgi:hypothetical protein
MRRLAVTVLAAVMLCGAASAHAGVGPPADGRVANNAMLDELVTVGTRFWQARDVTPCATPTILLSDTLNNVGYSDGACRIWIQTRVVRDQQKRPGAWGPYLCAVMTHELGHSGGLGHTATGVMSEAWDDAAIPSDCRRWATKATASRATARPRHRNTASWNRPHHRTRKRSSRS